MVLGDGPQQLAIHGVQPALVDLHQVEGSHRELCADRAVAAPSHLGEVADTFQQPVGDARRASAALSDDLRCRGGQGDLQDASAASQDLLQLRPGVVVEPIRRPEPLPQRAGDAPHARGGPDDRHVLDLQPHGPCARSLAEHHVEREVLHGWIQDLLDDMAEPMDLVDEQDVALAQAGEDRGEIARALDGRSRCGADLCPDLRGDNICKGRLAEARRAVQQDVIDRLGPMACRIEEDGQVLLDALLARELVQAAGPDSGLERELLRGDLGGADPLDRHDAIPPPRTESNM